MKQLQLRYLPADPSTGFSSITGKPQITFNEETLSSSPNLDKMTPKPIIGCLSPLLRTRLGETSPLRGGRDHCCIVVRSPIHTIHRTLVLTCGQYKSQYNNRHEPLHWYGVRGLLAFFAVSCPTNNKLSNFRTKWLVEVI